jgi:predicted GNAT family acetyltransferase
MEIQHEPDRHRFVIATEDGEATLTYRHAGSKTLDFRSTFVPEAQRGHRVGEVLVQSGLDSARAQGYSVIPSCPFGRTVVRRHSEYADLLVEG